MMRWRTWMLWLTLLAVALGVGLLDHRPRSLTDLGASRAVALESDDWGLRGFVPDASALAGLDREALGGTPFPPVYWRSTLEDATDLEEMTQLLVSHRGRDGLPAVFQPNMILCDEDVDGPDAYRRPGLAEAERAALAAGVWHPELHGADHVDGESWARAVAEGGAAVRDAATRGVLAFPGSHYAYELGPERPLDVVRGRWSGLPDRFRQRFGRSPRSVIAPDYVWDRRHEDLFRGLNLRIVQAKDHQRRRDLEWRGMPKRIRSLLERQIQKVCVRDIAYLDRNAFFEPAQHEDPEAVFHACLAQVRGAWKRGEPAVVETHRVNFVQTDAKAERQGRDLLARLLSELDSQGPLYVSDSELADLQRRGVSAAERGPHWVVRNTGPASRLAVLQHGTADGPRTVLVPPRSTLLVARADWKVLQQISLD